MIYGVNDTPPQIVTLLNGLQHVGLIAIYLVYPLLVFRLAGTAPGVIANLLAIAMLVLGVATFLQVLRLGPFGSGYMCPSTFTAIYLSPSLVAATIGGLPLVFGMTMFAGALEVALAPLLQRLRPIFPPEISGLVVFMVGVSAGMAGVRSLLGAQAAPVAAAEWWVGGITFATMVVLNIWGTGIVRMVCTLLGLLAGYAAAAVTGIVGGSEMALVAHASTFGLPDFSTVSWSFDVGLAVPFAIASVAAAMKVMGNITVCQRTNDANWVRPDMRSITGGVLADGAATALGGFVGAVGTNSSTPSVGLAAAVGVASRQVAYAIGALFLLLGFFPKLAAALAVMPRPVIVAALLFSVSYIIINGLQVMTSRLLDARRTLVIGLSIIAGTAVEVFPTLAAGVPKSLAPLFGSSLVFSTVIALSLNLLFRLGVRKTLHLEVDPSDWKVSQIDDELRKQGGIWGARADVISRASWAIAQVIDAVAENCWREGPLAIDVSFDEFNLDVDITYHGEALEFPAQRPSEDEILDSEGGVRRLAGYMLRHIADRVRSEAKDDNVHLKIHFDH
ncbi:MAG TPA: solute carrier family 23 protein [Burkholderiales bacterium]|nr:solute carrier family 23 protein [Burkholderiales bacterium]